MSDAKVMIKDAINEGKEAQSMVRELIALCNDLASQVKQLKAENNLLKEMLDAKQK